NNNREKRKVVEWEPINLRLPAFRWIARPYDLTTPELFTTYSSKTMYVFDCQSIICTKLRNFIPQFWVCLVFASCICFVANPLKLLTMSTESDASHLHKANTMNNPGTM